MGQPAKSVWMGLISEQWSGSHLTVLGNLTSSMGLALDVN